jgi:hypothetical protein
LFVTVGVRNRHETQGISGSQNDEVGNWQLIFSFPSDERRKTNDEKGGEFGTKCFW